MIIDGKKLAKEIKNSLREKIFNFKTKPRLAIVKVGSDTVTEKFLEQKKKFAGDVGISIRIYDFPESISTTKLRKEVSKIVHIKENTGVIVQLPLPKLINTQYILDTIPPEKDPDTLSSKSIGLFVSGRSRILPPVVGAINYIFTVYGIELVAKNVVVFGAGRLVGRPVAIWLMQKGSTVTVFNEHSKEVDYFSKNADIVISGAGKPKLIIPEMIKDKMIAIDCGTSETEGLLVGDFDPEVSKKASLFTPTPGGMGPLTVAMLFSNLVEFAKRDKMKS